MPTRLSLTSRTIISDFQELQVNILKTRQMRVKSDPDFHNALVQIGDGVSGDFVTVTELGIINGWLLKMF